MATKALKERKHHIRRIHRTHSARSPLISLILTAALLPIIGIVPFTPAAHADNPPRKILTGWIPYYRTYSSAGKQNGGLDSALASADLIKEVMPFWYSLDSATKITDLYTPANPNNPIADTLNKIRLAGYQIIPTITDSTSSKDPKTGKLATMVLSNLLADSAKRDVVVQTISDFVVANNFDGIDLDFENFAYVDGISSWPTTQVRFIAFMKSLSASLHAKGKLLSLTSPPLFDPASGKKGYWVYSWADIASSIDRLRIMTYDYSTSNPGPIGPITWVEQTVQYAISVAPASKVYVGLPGYGRDWVTAVQGICPSTPINYLTTVKPTAAAGTFVMRDAATLASTYGATPSYQAKYGETTFTYQKVYNGNTADGQLTQCTATRVVWYQDAQGFGLRANLVAKYRLGGLTQWTLGMEDPAATDAIRIVAKSIAPDVVLANLLSDIPATIYGGVANLSGTFTLPDKKPLTSLPVRIEIKTASTDWTPIFSGTTNVNGVLTVPIIIGENTKARMISDPTWERLEGHTLELNLQTARKISWLSAPTSVKHGVDFSLTGNLTPAPVAGDFVTLTLTDGAKLRKTVTVDSSGTFSITLNEPTAGMRKYQLSSSSSEKYLASTSDFVTVVVR
jgi:spore germination protein YaaH